MLIATNKIDVCGNMTGNTPNPLLDEILSALQTIQAEHPANLDGQGCLYGLQIDTSITKVVDLSNWWYLICALTPGRYSSQVG
jgi:hypothetical protein